MRGACGRSCGGWTRRRFPGMRIIRRGGCQGSGLWRGRGHWIPHFTQNFFINIPKFPHHFQPVLSHHLRALNQRSHHPLIIPLQMQILPNPQGLPVLPLHGNHERRPQAIEGYQEKVWRGGVVYQEEEYPSLLRKPQSAQTPHGYLPLCKSCNHPLRMPAFRQAP